MPRYLLEAYVGDSPAAQSEVVDRAKRVVSLGPGISHIRTTFVPDDQVVLHVFEAPSAGALQRAGTRAGLQYERLAEAYETDAGGAGTHNDEGGVS
jgi:hypothetical protein